MEPKKLTTGKTTKTAAAKPAPAQQKPRGPHAVVKEPMYRQDGSRAGSLVTDSWGVQTYIPIPPGVQLPPLQTQAQREADAPCADSPDWGVKTYHAEPQGPALAMPLWAMSDQEKAQLPDDAPDWTR